MLTRTGTTVVLALAASAVVSLCASPEQPTAGLSPALDLRPSVETVMPSIRWFTAQVRALFGSFDAATDSLRDLDAATLADIGIDRSEIGSIAAESRGDATVTRRRIAAALHHG